MFLSTYRDMTGDVRYYLETAWLDKGAFLKGLKDVEAYVKSGKTAEEDDCFKEET